VRRNKDCNILLLPCSKVLCSRPWSFTGVLPGGTEKISRAPSWEGVLNKRSSLGLSWACFPPVLKSLRVAVLVYLSPGPLGPGMMYLPSVPPLRETAASYRTDRKTAVTVLNQNLWLNKWSDQYVVWSKLGKVTILSASHSSM